MANEAVAAWDSRFQELLSAQTERVIAQPITTQHLRHGEAIAPLADIRGQLEEVWSSASLTPRAKQSRNVVLAETAEAIARSIFAVAVLDANLPTVDDEPPTWVPTPPQQPSQQPSQQSDKRVSLSPAKRRQLSTQRLSLSPTKLSQPLSQRLLLSPTKRSQAISQRLSFSPTKRLSFSPTKGSRSESPYMPSSSAPYSQSSAASSIDVTPTSTALQRLSMLAEDINTTETPGRQHSVLSYWPSQRGVSTNGYVSSVLASSTRHMDVINERRQRAESRRRKRKSQIFGASSQTQGTATQDEMEDSGPAGMEPATQPLPKLAPPVIGSSQLPPVPSSQAIFSSQVMPHVMSQPLSGRHGMRSPKKKGKRKSGF